MEAVDVVTRPSMQAITVKRCGTVIVCATLWSTTSGSEGVETSQFERESVRE